MTKKITPVVSVDEKLKDQEIIIKGRLHNYRVQSGKLAFAVIREKFSSIQCVLLVSENLSKNMFEYAKRIPKESIVEIKGKVTIPEKPIQGCS